MSFKIIKTKCGREFKVDADMFAELSKSRWYYRPMRIAGGKPRGYA
jgi:hypothetical protein